MKASILVRKFAVPFILGVALSAGCATHKEEMKNAQPVAAQGPNIMSIRTPSTIELSQTHVPNQPAQVFADVADFSSNVSDVRLKFLQVPLEIPMVRVGGSTWRADITPEQLSKLAVGGQTTRYEVSVIAKDDAGQISASSNPAFVAVKAPDLSSGKSS